MTPVRSLVILACIASALTAPALAQKHPSDKPGKDYPLFNRMQGFHRYAYDEKTFDRYEFPIDAKKTQGVEGHTYRVTYMLNQGDGPLPSSLQIVRNHQNAVRKAGGAILYEDLHYGTTVMRVSRDGNDVWIDLRAIINGNRYDLVIVEQEAMVQEIVANAEAWKGDLASAGHVAIYGINFDTDKAVVKPESEPVLAEMAKLLKDNPSLNVFIVGHTDSTGSYEHNLKLSQDRAAAVVSALASAHGIAAARMTAVGVGPVAPVATNDSEDGRAKNRRVELVKR